MADAKKRSNTKDISSRDSTFHAERDIRRSILHDSSSISSTGTKLRHEPGMYNLFAESESFESFIDSNNCPDEDCITETVIKIQNFESGDAPIHSNIKEENSKFKKINQS